MHTTNISRAERAEITYPAFNSTTVIAEQKCIINNLTFHKEIKFKLVGGENVFFKGFRSKFVLSIDKKNNN